MRLLSGTQAKRCETSERPRCRCRCQGALHGAKRSQLAEYFEALADEDPHKTTRQTRQLRLPPPFSEVA